jgi:predicted sulfurtransferase
LQLVEDHKAWVAANGLDIRGRIYFSSQGVNAQYGGRRSDALAYLTHLSSCGPQWQDIRYTVWPSPSGHAFPKLRLKYKPNLISLAGGIAGLPVTSPDARAQPLQPSEWRQLLAQAEQRQVVVLDVRNGYEWDAGHFQGAQRPAEEVFAETPVGESQADVPEPLRDAPPDTPVMVG